MAAQEQSGLDQAVQYVLKNKLKVVLYTWAAGISASMVSSGNRSVCRLPCARRLAQKQHADR